MKTFEQLKWKSGIIVDRLQKNQLNEAVFITVTCRKTKGLELGSLVGLVTAAGFERKIDPAIIELYLKNIHSYNYKPVQ